MTFHLTVENMVDWVVHKQMDSEISEKRQGEILPAMRYNVLVDGLNLSSILIISTIAFALLATLTAAATVASLGFIMRVLVLIEKEKYFAPVPLAAPLSIPNKASLGNWGPYIEVPSWGGALGGQFKTLFGAGKTEVKKQEVEEPIPDKVRNLFARIGGTCPKGWTITKIYFGYSHNWPIWDNKVPLPNA